MKTALITGASDGIGLAFARLFARKGINLILIARNESRLDLISKELSSPAVAVKYYAMDLSHISNAMLLYKELRKNKTEIDFLVNNAGFGINGEYTSIDWEKELEMLNLNMITVAYFTKVFARDMKERKSGRILNIGSTGSFMPAPYMAGYAASKAFVLSLSEAVNFELKDSGVSVSTLCPGVTDTKFHTVANTENTIMSKLLSHSSADAVARYGYRLMMKGRSSGIEGFFNKNMIFFTRLLPRNVSVSASGRLLKAL
jgi:uncharacterized protein